jgi:hypothetical protein
MVKYGNYKDCPHEYKKKNENPLEQSEYKAKKIKHLNPMIV